MNRPSDEAIAQEWKNAYPLHCGESSGILTPYTFAYSLIQLAERTLTKDQATLAKFYGVTTLAAIVAIQDRQIERLQQELARYKPDQPAFTRVREG